MLKIAAGLIIGLGLVSGAMVAGACILSSRLTRCQGLWPEELPRRHYQPPQHRPNPHGV